MINSALIYSILTSVALAQAPNGPTINTPTSVAQCLPSLLTFGGGTPPYRISVLPGGQTQAAPLAELGSHDTTQFTWKVNLPANTPITLMIRDDTGAINYAQAVTIQPSSDSTCLGSNGNPPSPSPTTPGAPVSTGSASVPSPSPNPKTNTTSGTNSTNSSPAAQPNSTSSTTGLNTTTNNSTNQTKSPSVFTPTSTNNVSNSGSASTNAPNSAASGTASHLKEMVAGLAIAGVALTLFA